MVFFLICEIILNIVFKRIFIVIINVKLRGPHLLSFFFFFFFFNIGREEISIFFKVQIR